MRLSTQETEARRKSMLRTRTLSVHTVRPSPRPSPMVPSYIAGAPKTIGEAVIQLAKWRPRMTFTSLVATPSHHCITQPSALISMQQELGMAARVCSVSACSWCGSLRLSVRLCERIATIVSGTRGGRVRPADRYTWYKPQQLRAPEQDGSAFMRADADNDWECQHGRRERGSGEGRAPGRTPKNE